MKDSKWTITETLSLRAAATRIGTKFEALQYHIDNGEIDCQDGRIFKSDCEKIKKQREKFIGIKTFIMTHDSKMFVTKFVLNRNKYIDFLEINNYFGVKLHTSEKMLFALPDTEEFYFDIGDVDYLNFKSMEFFDDFGLSEQDKVNKLIRKSKGHPIAIKYLKEFTESLNKEGQIYTPSYTVFVDTVLSTNDVNELSNEDIDSIVDDVEYVKTKELLLGFYNWVLKYEDVKYGIIELKKRESIPVEAYSYDEIIDLAILLFEQKYDDENDLTFKALENHIYAEMWLFLSLHYVCGWRAADICKNWVYLNLSSSDNPFKIDPRQIKESILSNSIQEKTYSDIALYAIRKLEMSFNLPSKSHKDEAGKLLSLISPDLRVFFGKLMLIAEYHHYTSDDGYMKPQRTSEYKNWTVMKAFFGNKSYLLTGRQNISSRRLNKSYLQGIENRARKDGYTALVAHMIASYARNHTNMKTTLIYLRDHGLTGESAEVVLYMMMQRGVMSVYLYKSLITAFPEQFTKLSMKEQTQIMERVSLSAYELETIGTGLNASDHIYTEFVKGETEEPKEILKAMYAIGQGKGKSKDKGVYCKKRALGMSCVYPTYEVCIAELCPYHVFTTDGIPTLLKVIKGYNEKKDDTGNNKYKVILRKHIIPAFQDILNEVIKNMSEQDKRSLKVLIMGKVNE